MSHTRNVEWKTITVCTLIARYVISNPPSKETNRPTENSILQTAGSLSPIGVYRW